MKVEAKQQAIKLRKQGVAMGDIARKLDVSKSSVSVWVRDVKLSQKQLKQLNANGHSVAAIEKRRISRLRNLKNKRNKITEEAVKEAKKLQESPLWCIAVSMYWGEGGKTQNMVRIANSDPDVIRLMMKFFREYCKIPEEKFRGHIHTFAHCDAKEAEKYWSSISGLSRNKFYKTYKKQSSASLKKRETLPYGTFQIYVHDTNFFFRMMGWIKAIRKYYS